ncbi:MAG TPA: hypothetical protein VGH84_08670 [Steroidobacteraceae bacterium]
MVSVSGAESAHQAPAVIDSATLPNARHEAFAQHIAAGHSLAESYSAAGYVGTPQALAANASRLAAMHHVRARIRQLTDAAAERAEISIASRMAWLETVRHADYSEFERVVACPCRLCWDDAAYATAVQQHLDAPDTVPAPDIEAPRPDCPGGPHVRIDTTPTALLSGAARAAYRGARYRPDGTIEVLKEERSQCIDLLNKMQGVYVTRVESRSLNISATVDAADCEPAALLAAYNRSRGAPSP